MKSTLYLKFILLYIILGFLSIFTVASLSSTLTTHYLESSISGNMYQSANLALHPIICRTIFPKPLLWQMFIHSSMV